MVAELMGSDPEQGPGVLPCWLSNELFLCPGAEHFGGREFSAVSFSMPGALHQRTHGGRWPDSVWQLDVAEAGLTYSLYRLDPRDSAWRAVGEVPRWDDTSRFEVAAWLPGRAIVVEHGLGPDYERRPPDGDDRHTEDIRITSPGRPPVALPSLQRAGKPFLRIVHALAAFESGEVVIVGQAKHKPTARVAHWAAGGKDAVLHDLGTDECWVEHHYAPSPSDQVVVGKGTNGGCAFRFDGRAWSSMEMPPSTSIRGYAREPKGTEWVVALSLEKDKSRSLQIWSRKRSATWKKIELPIAIPAVKVEWGNKGCGDQLPNGKVWAQGDGDVWVLAQACGPCGLGLNLLFHTRKPTAVCRRSGFEAGCATITRDDVLVDRCGSRGP